MSAPQINGVTMSAPRRRVIDALFQLPDYSLVPPAGQKYLPAEDRKKVLGPMTTGSLARMEQDGIITRVMNATHTVKVTLAKEWVPYAHERVTDGTARKPRQPRKRKATGGGGKRMSTAQIAAHLPDEILPPIGSQLTVFLVQQDADGTYHVGLRNGTQSWLTQIEGHTQRIPV